MDRFVERAVVLSTVDYGEADRIVTLFTEGRGRMSAFAAGARKSRRRFAGALEPTTLIHARLVERHGTTVRLDGADIERSYVALRTDLPRLSRALYCLELCRELVREHEPHPALFALLVDYLGRLEEGKAGPTSLIAFELDALAHAGLMPRFDSCAVCGGPVGGDAVFDPDHGGVVCHNDRGRMTGGVRVDAQLTAALVGLQRGARTPMPADQRQRAREVLNRFIAHQLGRRLHSVDFLVQVGLD
ncbi:MAG: DNA repair protein RecO [Myxococcaceae bacterium]|nr:DNA repair protein RecO [Myxococcaceae bacterium]